ncbi:MAG: cysteine--tRNA ligase [Flavobacteriales bacterium]|nr:cysteine--tRNA ligase [Flavobacteriales bacterium]
MESSLKLFDTLTRKKVEFEPINPPHVGLYVCGPTVYSDVHLGNVRSFLTFDVVFRYLNFIGYKVRYVRNITDVGHLTDDADAGEDKIAKKARLEQVEPMEVVQKYTYGFHEVMKIFNILPPSIEPTATGHIIEQIEMVEQIIARGFGYEVDGSVYFDVRKFQEEEGYGALSGRNIDELQNNTRALDGQSQKRDPLDFAIWKKAEKGHLMHWPSPWGEGFPGWHLECSAMSRKYLGDEFDIHGGGMDLKFPHHDCEIAQNIGATGKAGPKYWMHGNMLTVQGRKMAKSEGNGFTPEELITGNHKLLEQGYSPMTVRFFMLQSHYSSTLDFSNDALRAAEKGYNRLMEGYQRLEDLKVSESSSVNIDDWSAKCKSAMDDDFNTPILISHLFEGVKMINLVASGRETISEDNFVKFKKLFEDYIFVVLGFKLEGNESNEDGAHTQGLMELLIKLRKAAKLNKDYTTADQIREELNSLGISLKDSPDGTSFEIN